MRFLASWYAAHCDGDWERSHGVHIGTLDNPGWRIAIDSRETEFEGTTVSRVKRERSEDDWIYYWVEGLRFEAACGPTNLHEALGVFQRLAAGGGERPPVDGVMPLESWYVAHCDGDWEHSYRVRIDSLDDPGWRITVNIQETELEGTTIPRTERARSADDWVHYWADGLRFEARCGPASLREALEVFERVAAREPL